MWGRPPPAVRERQARILRVRTHALGQSGRGARATAAEDGGAPGTL